MSEPEKKPELISEPKPLRERVHRARRAGRTIGFVPTMGALHEGHLSLVRAAAAECDVTVVSIYVNPTQFGQGEDFDRYPRTLESDMAQLGPLGVDWVFAPTDEVVYPPGFDTWVHVGKIGRLWEGACRPRHFRGVATIVLKLFNLVQPDVAYFGEKDFQQLRVLEQMVADLNLPVTIRGCPIVREPDGLAMSSRNKYLDADARQQALVLSQSLRRAAQLVAGGERRSGAVVEAMARHIQTAPLAQIDYVAVVDPRTLEQVPEINCPAQAIVAVRIGETRLIDNLRLEPPVSP